jgi:hypothetical protein
MPESGMTIERDDRHRMTNEASKLIHLVDIARQWPSASASFGSLPETRLIGRLRFNSQVQATYKVGSLFTIIQSDTPREPRASDRRR